MKPNLILNTDSYKSSHFRQYPPNTTGLFSYFESRGGQFDHTLFFGLQYLLKEYLCHRITHEEIDEAKAFFAKHGEPFPEDGWRRIATKFDGHLPICIKAVPEGSIIPGHNVLFTVESTDPETFWVVNWLETLLVRVWYPITVSTLSMNIRRIIHRYLKETADDPDTEIAFKLHDFGARGVSSDESAGIGGMSHLVNFMGSDTVEGVRYANHYYDCDMAGFSIPAAEHSTICSWGKKHEHDAFRNMIRQFGGKDKLVACVSDSYDLWAAVKAWSTELRREVEAMGGTLVIRPDSGDPATIVVEILKMMEHHRVPFTKNSKGFKVLPPYFRLIQGDGVNINSIEDILKRMKLYGYSASNIAFGCGGGLLQKLDRDTLKFAYKASSVQIEGDWQDVFKDPVTDPGKASKRGRLMLVKRGSEYITMTEEVGKPTGSEDVLVPVFENGRLLREYTLEEVRNRARADEARL